jgi:hypothetical protein
MHPSAVVGARRRRRVEGGVGGGEGEEVFVSLHLTESGK